MKITRVATAIRINATHLSSTQCRRGHGAYCLVISAAHSFTTCTTWQQSTGSEGYPREAYGRSEMAEYQTEPFDCATHLLLKTLSALLFTLD